MEETFGKFIKEKREKKGVTLRNFAESLKISAVYESSIENGKRPAPSYEVLKNMAEFLSLSERDKGRMYDLASKTKSEPVAPYDIAEYVRKSSGAREVIRTAKGRRLKEADWKRINLFIKNSFEKI